MKSEKSNDNLCIFWFCLKLVGIDAKIRNSKRKKYLCMNIYKYLIILMMILCLTIDSRNCFMTSSRFYYIPASQLITTSATLLIYICLANKTASLIMLRKIIIKLSEVKSRKITFLIMYILILSSFLLTLFPPVTFFCMNIMRIPKHSVCGIYNINVENFIPILNATFNIFLRLTVPTVFACFFCAVCCQWREIII